MRHFDWRLLMKCAPSDDELVVAIRRYFAFEKAMHEDARNPITLKEVSRAMPDCCEEIGRVLISHIKSRRVEFVKNGLLVDHFRDAEV